MIKSTGIPRHLVTRRKMLDRGGARQAGSKLALMRMAVALARIRPVLHLRALRKAAFEGIEEGGAPRLEVVVRDVGLRCHTSHAHFELDMLLGLTNGVKEE